MRFEGTSTRVPVFGLRPTRGCLCLVRKLPNPRISILSPVLRERTMLSKMASTITSESFRVISTTRDTSSINSALVMRCRFLLGAAVLLTVVSLASGAHYFFNCHCGVSRVPLVVFELGLFLFIRNSPQSVPYLLIFLARLDDFIIKLFF